MCENTLLYMQLFLVSTFVGGKKGVKFGACSRKNSYVLLPQGNAQLAPCHILDALFLFAE